MDIKSKIASFEAHNAAVRTAVVTKPSPPRNQTPATSTTSMASHSRRSRIQREVNNKAQVPVQQQQLPTGSLAERRRARQQQKQRRLARETSTERSTTDSLPYESSYSSYRDQSINSRSKSLTSRSKSVNSRSKSLNSRRPSEAMSSNRRFVHSMSMESSNSYEENPKDVRPGMEEVYLSPERRLSPANAAKVHRMHRRKQQHEGYHRTEPQRIPDSEENSLASTRGEPTDDEATLTSVRQIMQPEGGPVLMRSASSSTIETADADASKLPPTNTQAFLTRSAFPVTDDDKTFDYGDRDDGSDGSITYEQRKEAEKRAREAKAGRTGEGFFEDTKSPLLNTEDVSYYRQALDTPAAKITAGIVVAATIGTVILGPVGLLVGAATVGIGVGVMQIPEEQRTHVKNKAVKTVHQAQESALHASEALSSSCAASCHDLGCTDQLPANMQECFEIPVETSGTDDEKKASMKERAGGKGPERSRDVGSAPGLSADGRKQSGSVTATGKRRAACLRNARIVPVEQIYSLEPSLQPRAWLDVMANANTTRDEKSEGMEEILILAKDKKHAKFFLEEGILDSIMLIITRFLDGSPQNTEDAEEFAHARKAAACCVILGKSHCAAVHTEGDLLLMSLYERGTVPEERQVAQMLYEIPHHVQVAISPTEEVFVLKQISMPQAEQLARSVKALADGQR